jgi:hypothetical protein
MEQKTVLRRRAQLAATLPFTPEIVRGSLLHRIIRHRSGCSVCADGKGHPACVLTVSYPGGATKQFSLRPEQRPVVEQWLQNYHKLKEALESICETNLELLRAEKKK